MTDKQSEYMQMIRDLAADAVRGSPTDKAALITHLFVCLNDISYELKQTNGLLEHMSQTLMRVNNSMGE